jgi:hypothetical protein
MRWATAVCGAKSGIAKVCSVARMRGLEILLMLGPGAHAPGFMLAPASQAKENFAWTWGSRPGFMLAPASQASRIFAWTRGSRRASQANEIF